MVRLVLIVEVHGGGRIVEHRQQILLHVPHRGGVFCQTAQHETDVVSVQLFQPTAYHLGRFVISGDPQHLAFGGTGVHKQVYDLVDGVLIVRAEPEQEVHLQYLIKIVLKLFRELEDIDLIKRKRRGLGRPCLIYVKDFSSGLPKAQVQNCTNSNSGTAESAILEQPKPQANKTDKNKTEWNDPDPIYSEGIREQLEDYFYQVLEVELLLRLCPDEEDTIYQIVDLLVDTCSTKRKILRIAGDDKPAEVVRSRLKKLNADHIRFVLESLAENTAPVRNMKQYLLAMLYNAPTTMNLYYQNKTNHDFARGSPKAG